MDNAKKLKRGEILFKEGEAPSSVFLLQSGKVGLMVERPGKSLEVGSVGSSSVLNDTGLFSNSRQAFTAEVLQEVKYLEIPLEAMKQQFEKSPPGIKLMLKSLSEDLRQTRQQLKVIKVDQEKGPCPLGQVHRLFTQVHLVARHIGKADSAKPAQIVVSWSAFKLYGSRFFSESPQRLRSLLDLLLKLKMVELTFAPNEEGEEDVNDVKFMNLQLLEDFAEFYQYHLFKGSRAEAIFVDPLALKVAKAMYEISVIAAIDHKGASKLDYSTMVKECKAKFQIELKSLYLDSLERKGLFVKRESFDDGKIVLSFDRAEFGRMAQYWSILLEIDKWNEVGRVVLEAREEFGAAAGPHVCTGCAKDLPAESKFCPNCGAKVAA